MDNQGTPDDSPPAYDNEVILPASTSNSDPPPPYPSSEFQEFLPPYSPTLGVHYAGLPQQPIQQLPQQQQVKEETYKTYAQYNLQMSLSESVVKLILVHHWINCHK